MSSVYWPKEEEPAGDVHRWFKRGIAAVELLLVSPAAVFMIALVLRGVRTHADEPSYTAGQVVFWYASRPWTTSVLLMAMPAAAMVLGVWALIRTWRAHPDLRQATTRIVVAARAYASTLLVAIATFVAAVVLLTVVVHALVA